LNRDEPATGLVDLSVSGFSDAFRTAPITMLITSAEDGRFLAVNEEYCRLVGYSENEIVGRRGDEFRFWVDPQQRNDVMQQILENGSVEGIEVQFKARTGENIVAILSASRTVFNDHKCVIWHAIDITAQRKTEMNLHSRTEHLHAVVSALNRFPVAIIDRNGLIRSVIGGGRESNRHSINPAEFRGRQIADLFGPENAVRMLEIVREVFETGETHEAEMLSTRAGYEFDLRVWYSPIYSTRGEVESILLISRDTTSSLQDTEALLRSKGTWQSMVEDLHDVMSEGFVVLDANHSIVSMNRAFENFFGVRRIELIGMDYRQLVRDKLAGVVVEADDFVARALRAPATEGNGDRFYCRVQKNPSDEERWLECTSNPIEGGLYAGGRVERCIDVTRYRAAEKLLLQLYSKLAKANQLGSKGASKNSTTPISKTAPRNISSLVKELQALFSSPYS